MLEELHGDGWVVVHLEYDVSSGPFLTMNFEFDQDHGPRPGPKLDNYYFSFSVQMEYSLPSCQSTYENPCPIFDPFDYKYGKNPDESGQKIVQTKSAIIEFNECDNPRVCHCNVETELIRNKAIVAGEKKILSIGELVWHQARATRGRYKYV